MARVLVTGVDGFTGRFLAPLLASQGDEVHGLVQHADAAVDGVTQLHVADLRSPPQVAQAVRAAAPQRVVHLAGIAFVPNRDMEAMYGVNLLGTRHLLEALCGLGSAPQRVLLASSANVYGNAAVEAVGESAPTAPTNDYAVSKLAMEFLCGLYASRLSMTICRPFNYTGVGQSESFLLPKIVGHVRRGAASIELGNLDVARDFSDVRNVCDLYSRLLIEPTAAGRTVNICSGFAHTLREVLDMVERLSGRRLEVRTNPDLVRANEVKRLRGDRSLLDSLLPTLPEPIALSDTLRWMIDAR